MSGHGETPLVSVVVASYRWPEALSLSLKSALSQSITRIEVIVVEDGWDRRSRHVVRDLGDPRVRWSRLLRNSGSQARPNSRGRSMARAPVVAYLGHDDLWTPDHLETLLDALDRSKADIAHAITVMPGYPILGTVLAGTSPATDREHVPPSSIAHLRDSPRVASWPRDASGELPVDYEFMFASRALGAEVVSGGRPTVFKVPAGQNLESFRVRDATAQREMAEQLALDPERLVRMAEDARSTGVSGDFSFSPPPVAPGELTAYLRRNKGLRSRFGGRFTSWRAEHFSYYPGWCAPEEDAGGSFRRIDSLGRAIVRFDAPLWPFFRVEIELAQASPRELDRLVIELDGEPLRFVLTEGESGGLRLTAEGRIGVFRRPSVIDIGISTHSAPAEQPATALKVRSIAIEPRFPSLG